MEANDVYARIREAKGPTKHCTACDAEHPVEDFTIKSSASLRLHSRCRDQQRAANRSSYQASPEKQREAAAARRARVREMFNAGLDEWLDGRPCARCGEAKAHMLAIHRDGENLRPFVQRGFTAADLPGLLAGATAECRSCRQPDPTWLRGPRHDG